MTAGGPPPHRHSVPEPSGGSTGARTAELGDRMRKVYVEPTNACNLACATCVRHAWDEPEGFMEWETFAAIVDGLAEARGDDGAAAGSDAGTAARPDAAAEAGPTLAFMGLGEPLLHPRFLDMVRLAKERALRVEVTTNALLLARELAEALADAGLDQLVVSIDGASAEAFGRVRSGASLAKVVENARYLHDQRGPYYGPRVHVGIEFVAMRSNVRELPGLNRLAAQIGASFVLVSNVLAYSPELVSETLYDRGATAGNGPATSATPRWTLPRMDAGEEVGAALGEALRTVTQVSILDHDLASANARCPFVHADACAVAWHGGVSPCPPLLHTYRCFVLGRREKVMTRWEVGRLPDESLGAIWAKPEYAAFRERVRGFDFPPCTDCDCDLAAGNLEDCVGNPHPVCGDCLWARGIIRCA